MNALEKLKWKKYVDPRGHFASYTKGNVDITILLGYLTVQFEMDYEPSYEVILALAEVIKEEEKK